MPLNVIVCQKQIPNPDLQFHVAADGLDIKRDALNYKVNGADEYALEEAVRIKEKHGGRVVALTAGPKRAEPILREALAKGADDAVRVTYEDPAAVDPMKVARILATSIRTIPNDLILTGVQSDDYTNSVTGGLIAAYLGLPHASVVTRVEVGASSLTVYRELEGGVLQVVEVGIPAVLTIQYGINVPRYAALPAIMKAARQPIRELGPSELGASSWEDFGEGYGMRVRALSIPEARTRAEMITGSIVEQGRRLAQVLRDRGFVRG